MLDWESCGQHHKELRSHYYHNVHIRSKQPGIYISNSLRLQCKLLQEWLDIGKMALCPWADQEGVGSCRLPDDHTAFCAAGPFLKGDWVAHLHILCSQSLLSFLLERLSCIPIWSVQSFKTQRLLVLSLFAPYIHSSSVLLLDMPQLFSLFLWPVFYLPMSVFPARWLNSSIGYIVSSPFRKFFLALIMSQQVYQALGHYCKLHFVLVCLDFRIRWVIQEIKVGSYSIRRVS